MSQQQTMLAALSPTSPVKYNLTIMKPDGQSRVAFALECTVADLGVSLDDINSGGTFNDGEWIDKIADAHEAGDQEEVNTLQQAWSDEKAAWLSGGGVTGSEMLSQALYEYLMGSDEAKRVGLTNADAGSNPFFTADSMSVTISGPIENGATVTVSGTTKWGN